MLAAGTAGFVGVAAFGGSVAHAFMEKISNDDGKQVSNWRRATKMCSCAFLGLRVGKSYPICSHYARMTHHLFESS